MTINHGLSNQSLGQPMFSSAGTPFSVVVDKNQVLSRFLVLLGGYVPSDMLVARNK